MIQLKTSNQLEIAAITSTSTERGENNRRRVHEKKLGIEKIATLENLVSAKCRKWVPNPQGF